MLYAGHRLRVVFCVIDGAGLLDRHGASLSSKQMVERGLVHRFPIAYFDVHRFRYRMATK